MSRSRPRSRCPRPRPRPCWRWCWPSSSAPARLGRAGRGLRVVPAADEVLAAGPSRARRARRRGWCKRFGGGFGPHLAPLHQRRHLRAQGGPRLRLVAGRHARRPTGSRARPFLDAVFAADRHGNTDALARRMGIMYVIWNDHMYSAWNEFDARATTSAPAARARTKCSHDPAPPRPPARLADPPGRPRRDQLVRRPPALTGLTCGHSSRGDRAVAWRTAPVSVRECAAPTPGGVLRSAAAARSASRECPQLPGQLFSRPTRRFQPSTSSALRDDGPV